jgi:predicted acetyltransferase
MKFVLPCKEYEQKAIEFIQEFYDHESEINGTGGLDGYLEKSTYSEWLIKVINDLDIANIPDGRVPAYTYFYVRENDDKIIGMINIRLALNDFLRKEGGHIGYSIRPSERKRGYGTIMLQETLAFCEVIGLCDIIITCNKSNVASSSMIKNCGGVLTHEFYSEVFKTDVLRYAISLHV